MKTRFTLPLLLMQLLVLSSCEKEDVAPKTGTVAVTMSYYYNAFQGYKPDTGADVYLFKDSDRTYAQKLIQYRIGSLEDAQSGERISADYTAEADVTGTATLTDVVYGDYLLVAASKGRYTYSVKHITVSSPSSSYVKNFGYADEFDDAGEPW